MGLDSSHSVRTPGDWKPLGADKDRTPCEEHWSYASIVGMKMYLSSNLRPDIAFAVFLISGAATQLILGVVNCGRGSKNCPQKMLKLF